MGTLDLDIQTIAGSPPFQPDAMLNEYIEPSVGKQLTFRVRSGSETVHDAILDLINGGGAAAYGMDIKGESWFIDRVRPDADVTAATVKIKPVNLPEMEGVWGVIVDGDDLTRIPGSQREVEFTVFVLAKATEYSTRSDLNNAKEVTVP